MLKFNSSKKSCDAVNVKKASRSSRNTYSAVPDSTVTFSRLNKNPTQEIQVLEDINRITHLKAYFQTPVAKGYRDTCKTKQRGQREGGGAGLVVRASDSEARVRVSLLTRVIMLCPLARQIYSPKVLVIPRKRWPRPNISQKSRTYRFASFCY